jgi:hypothetical protein
MPSRSFEIQPRVHRLPPLHRHPQTRHNPCAHRAERTRRACRGGQFVRLLAPLAIVIVIAAGFATLASAAETGPIDLDLYGRLLEKHTRIVEDLAGTRVDYASLEKSEDWKRLARQVHDARPVGLAREAKLAFWINAYNILTIDLIVHHYPIDGIREIGSFFSPVWDIEVATIAGRTLSLGEIEHDILRKMDEPLIHGAIVCASASCPPLARTPFRPDQISQDLAAAMRTWLSNREKGIALDRSSKVIRLSKVFDWFESDFDSRGGVLSTIADFLPPEDASWIRQEGDKASIRYFDYDWSHNDLK